MHPHNFKNTNLVVISGLSTTASEIGGNYNIGVTTSKFVVTGVGTTSSGISTVGVTGIVTYFNVSGESFGLQVVGNYGTGKSHLMSLVSLIAENGELLELVQEEWFFHLWKCENHL